MEIEINGKIDIPGEFDDIAKRYFDHYIFYRSYRKGESVDENDVWFGGGAARPFKRGWCTACGQWTESDKSCSGGFRELWDGYHNAFGTCPNCGAAVQYKAMGRAGYCKNLTETPVRLLFVQKLSPERVVLRGCEVYRTLNAWSPDVTEYQYVEVARYDLQPGSSEMWKRSAWRCYAYGDPRAVWERKKSIGEPWPMTVNCGTAVDYTIALSEDGDDLAGTFLQYLPLDAFAGREWMHGTRYTGTYRTNRTPWGMILSYAARFPSVEMAAKRGWWDLLDDLCGLGKQNARYINWNAKKPEAFFRIQSRADAKILAETRRHVDALRFYAKGKLPAAEAVRLANCWAYDDLADWAKKLGEDPMELDYYLGRQCRQNREGAILLKDYREAAAQLGRDLTVPLIRWPKNLRQAHDDAVQSVKAMTTERQNEVYRKQRYAEYFRRYEFYADGWCAIVPERLEDITLEGKLQHHCVGGYVGRHAEGKTVIIFLRPELLRAVPRYTVEISPDGMLRQVQGFHNEYENKPSPEAMAFMDKWFAEIARRLAKEKRENKKAARSAETTKERATA